MDAIRPILSPALTPLAGPAAAASAPAAGDFVSALSSALERVDAGQHKAEQLARAYQLGEGGVTLEQSMVALQEANVSLQFAVQVRNRLVSAYHDIMNMPV